MCKEKEPNVLVIHLSLGFTEKERAGIDVRKKKRERKKKPGADDLFFFFYKQPKISM
jgi:hypothetical protein